MADCDLGDCSFSWFRVYHEKQGQVFQKVGA
jgi:hypothetical protein